MWLVPMERLRCAKSLKKSIVNFIILPTLLRRCSLSRTMLRKESRTKKVKVR